MRRFVFDVKTSQEKQDGFLFNGYKTLKPIESTYAVVVPLESTCIAFTYGKDALIRRALYVESCRRIQNASKIMHEAYQFLNPA